MTLRRTPLYDFHVALNAKMVPFGGWEMPVQYDSILQEHGVTRRQTAVFDICHMGELIVEGDGVGSGLDRLVTQRLRDLPCGTCRYGAMLNENGGVMDDLIVFRMEEQRWMLVVNAACADKDAAHLQRHLDPDARLHDVSAETGKIDVQGPGSRELLAGLVPEVGRLAYYTVGTFDVLGEKAVVSRTGYTGELGYEIYFPWGRISDLWTRLLDAGAQPAGLGARDILRLEMGYPLYGHEMSEEICALESGMGRFVDWEKDFIGKSALLKYKEKGLQKKLMCFAAGSRQSPRAHQKIFSSDKVAVGEVTSGAFSPAVGRGIGMGFVPPEYQEGRTIFFGEEGKMVPAEIVSRPVYKDGSLKF